MLGVCDIASKVLGVCHTATEALGVCCTATEVLEVCYTAAEVLEVCYTATEVLACTVLPDLGLVETPAHRPQMQAVVPCCRSDGFS